MSNSLSEQAAGMTKEKLWNTIYNKWNEAPSLRFRAIQNAAYVLPTLVFAYLFYATAENYVDPTLPKDADPALVAQSKEKNNQTRNKWMLGAFACGAFFAGRSGYFYFKSNKAQSDGDKLYNIYRERQYGSR